MKAVEAEAPSVAELFFQNSLSQLGSSAPVLPLTELTAMLTKEINELEVGALV